MKLTKGVFDPNDTVAKFIFSDDTAITEVVAYKYRNRGVVCFSTMSGCPIGCLFCGTGKKYIRNLTSIEMLEQIEVALNWIGDQEKIQIMAMSMGEPMLNWKETQSTATHCLGRGFDFYISTVGVFDTKAQVGIIYLAQWYPRFGLQISLHSSNQNKRNKLLGEHPLLMTLPQIKKFAGEFTRASGKPTYFNYICIGEETEEDVQGVSYIVGEEHHLTCSVLCNTGDFVKADPKPAIAFGERCAAYGVKNWSVFDPAGQDTIGGGCGQLLYVQEFLRKK